MQCEARWLSREHKQSPCTPVRLLIAPFRMDFTSLRGYTEKIHRVYTLVHLLVLLVLAHSNSCRVLSS
jgi:hypothetical protein